jgi:hypothetical protein
MAIAKKRRRKAGEWSSSDVDLAGSRSSLFAMFYASLFRLLVGERQEITNRRR